MKNRLNAYRLPVRAAVLGAVGLILRQLLYALAVDEKNLLSGNHPLEIALWAVVLAAAVWIVVSVWKLDGSARYEDNFFPSPAAAFGHFLMAAGIALTVLLHQPGMPGNLGVAWKVLGYLAVPALVWAGICRLRGRQPFFLIHAAACLFLLLHIMNQYQRWCGDPQLQDYIFALLAAMMLAFFAFYTASFAAGCGKRRMQLGAGLLAVLLGIVCLSGGEFPFLYLGGISWAMTDLCCLQPRPKEREESHDPS